MRKLTLILLTLLLIAGVFSAAVFADDAPAAEHIVSGLWELAETSYDGETGYELTGYNGTATDVYIPDTLGDGETKYNILKVGNGLFENNTAINSVTLGNGIRVIGENAFRGASSLTCAVINEKLSVIGGGSFDGCTNMNSILLYDGILKIGENAFRGCDALTVYCNPGTAAYEYAEANGIRTEILNPDAIPETYTQDGATYYISNGEAMFMGVSGTDRFIIPSSVKNTPVTKLSVQCELSGVKELYIPDSVTRIPEGFNPSLVIYCGENGTFRHYADEHSIPYIITETAGFLPEITENGFTYCIGKNFAVLRKVSDDLSGEITVPETVNGLPVTIIYPNAFQLSQNGITKINLPEGLKTIMSGAFGNCSKLTEINMPSTLTYVGANLFRDFHILLNEITYPPNAVVCDGAFGDCHTKKFIIPADTRNINPAAMPDSTYYDGNYHGNEVYTLFYVYKDTAGQNFCEEYGLSYYIVDNGNPEPYEYTDEQNILYLIVNDRAVIIDDNMSYEENPEETYDIEIPETVAGVPVTEIADYAFYANSRLNKVYIPESVTRIRPNAFYDCMNITEINIPQNITEIEPYAFCGLNSLTEINLPDGLKTIGNSGLGGLISVKEIKLPDSLETIGAYAFCDLGAESIDFPSSVKSIGEYAFSRAKLKTLEYPNAKIGLKAFEDCLDLTTVTFSDAATTLHERVFEGCVNLKEVYITEKITKIEDYAFFECPRLILITPMAYGVTFPTYKYIEDNNILHFFYFADPCTYECQQDGINYYLINTLYENVAVVLPGDYKEMESVTIPESVTYNGNTYTVKKIADCAFDGCPIKELSLPKTLTTIGEMAFRSCMHLSELNIPESVTYIGSIAFAQVGYKGNLVYPGCTVGYGAFSTNHFEYVEVPEGVTYLPKYVFALGTMGGLSLPESLERIATYAFHAQKVNGTVIIPAKTFLEEEAFCSVPGLKKVIISEGMTSLPSKMSFDNCSDLELVYLPKSLTYIDYECFNRCPSAIFCVYENSYAHEFVEKKGFPYFLLGKKKNPEIAYGSAVSGTVTYSDGTPVIGASVDILYDDGSLKENVTTDENGAYTFTYAEVGSYTVRATDKDGKTGMERLSIKRKNVFDVFLAGETGITVKQSYTLSGTVLPAGNAAVTLTDEDGNVIVTVSADENGKYSIPDVSNGTYILRASNTNGEEVREITVFNADLTVDFSIESSIATASISGRVTDESGTAKLWAQVTLYNENGAVAASAKTDENGSFAFENLPAGKYALVATATEIKKGSFGRQKVVNLYGYAYIDASDGGKFTADITLSEGSDNRSRLSGRVIDLDGNTYSAQVILTNVFRWQLSFCTAKSDGVYSFDNVGDGVYLITAVTHGNGAGFALAVVSNGRIFGNTDALIFKLERTRQHEEHTKELWEKRNDGTDRRKDIADEKHFYDGLSEREKSQLSRDYIGWLDELIGGTNSCSINVPEGVTVNNHTSAIESGEIESGDDISFSLDISKHDRWTIGDIGARTDEEFMQQQIEDIAGSKGLGQYYDITFKKDGKSISNIAKDTDTTGKIRITMPIPEEYRGHKHYSFVHMHNGIPTTLVDLDDDPNTITFETDRFSTFALMFDDEGNDEPKYTASITSNGNGKIYVSSQKSGTLYITGFSGSVLGSVEKHSIAAGTENAEYTLGEGQRAFLWDDAMTPLCQAFGK